ncbi:MAG TPA: tRNA (5-methylaminomethyl-2-thiouridine)(34)-methyltransferase MnmD [Bacteroidia bacterium]
MKREIIKTADGSHSLYVEGLDEHYHSIHGAIQEAKHVFIKTGLQHLYNQGYSQINILEIGLGTGLNALLTCLEAEKLDIKIHYIALEAFPLELKLVEELNYVELLSESEQKEIDVLKAIMNKMHISDWEKENSINPYFTLVKIKNTLQDVTFKGDFDLIYFDAFGPRVQPEMWTEELFAKLFAATKMKGSLVTYCAKGEVKRSIKKTGFFLETLPGPPGKREMVRGTKN